MEIERKFLTNRKLTIKLLQQSAKAIHVYEQGYLNDENGQKLRIRIADRKKAIITIKGPSVLVDGALVRPEDESEMELRGGLLLLAQCKKKIVKVRYIVDYMKTIHEVDLFVNLPQKIILTEIEMKNTKEALHLAPWVGKEVSNDESFSNAKMIRMALPYSVAQVHTLIKKRTDILQKIANH